MNKAYINRKIENCKNLIESAKTDDQIEVYEGYLLFWRKKLKPEKTEKIYVDVDNAQLFEAEFPLRKAYYTRDGKQHKTKRFKEYLNNL